MIKQIFCLAVAAMLLAGPADAHGGGGHGGGYYGGVIFVPAPQLTAAAIGNYEKIHTVAVLSAIGGTLKLMKTGFFTGNSKTQDISAWNMDDLVTSTLREFLGSRFVFKDVAYDRASLAAIPNGPLENSKSDVQKYLTGVSSDGIDAFIVVHPDLEKGCPGLEGLSIVTDQLATNLWLNYEIDIVDAKSHEYIAKVSSRVQVREGVPPSFPGLVMPPALTPAADLVLTDTQNTLLHHIMEHDLPLTLVETIRPLALGVPLPQPGARKIVDIPKDKDPYPGIGTVAVISAIGDQIEFTHVGALFGASRSVDHLPTPADWNLDGLIEQQISAAIAPRFKVKDMGQARAALVNISPVDADGKLLHALSAIPPRADVDAYVVVLKYRRPVDNLTATGVGLANRGTLAGGFSFVFADYVIALVDAHSLKVLAARTGQMSPEHAAYWPVKSAPNTLWPDNPPAAAAYQLVSIRTGLEELLTDSVPETVFDMRMTGKMVADDLPAPNAGGTSPQSKTSPAAAPPSMP